MSVQAYYDEEDCLGLEVFLAELELIVGNRREKPDQVALLELLPKLAATIPKTDRAILKLHQRRCEAGFKDLLLQGMSSPVARLIGICLDKFYTHGDIIAIYSFVADLHKALNLKEPAAKTMSEATRHCLLDSLAELSLHHGRYLSSAAAESSALARALLGRSASSTPVRTAALKLSAAVVEGLNPMDRGAPAVQAEAWALFTKYHKDRSSEDIRVAAISVVSGLARAACSILWNDGAYIWDQAVRLCAASLLDEGCSAGLCHAYAQALADLAGAVRRDGFGSALRDERRPAKKAALQAIAGRGALTTCLALPLVQGGAMGRKEACTSLAVAWTSYIASLDGEGSRGADGGQAKPGAGSSSLTDELVELAVQVALLGDSASQAAKSASAGGVAAGQLLGSALASGELPHVSACLLYVLRSGIVEALTETGQRRLLGRLLAVVSRPGTSPPAAVVALEGISILLSALGEMSDEEAGPLEATIATQLSSVSAAVRQQAAQALAVLAMSLPASCARLLASSLAALEAASRQLAGVANTVELPAYMGHGATPASVAARAKPFTSPGSSEAALIAHTHGCALALSSLLLTASKLPLSCPSALWEQAVALASRLIHTPYSKGTRGRAVERETGYLVVGALCRGGLGEEGQLAGRVGQLLGLMELAFGEEARQALDQKGAERPGGDMELAMQLWWRSVALQSLATLLEVAVVSGLAGKQRTEQQVSLVVDLLTPLLTAIENQPLLLDPSLSRGLLAACVATFQMRLLRVYLILPGGWPLAQAHGQLLRLCVRAVTGAGAPLSASAALYHTALRHCLPKEDTALGPWPPGRDTAEDELMVFVGEPGGPHQQLWESGIFSLLSRSMQAASTGSSAAPLSAFGDRSYRNGNGSDSPSAASAQSLSPTPSFALNTSLSSAPSLQSSPGGKRPFPIPRTPHSHRPQHRPPRTDSDGSRQQHSASASSRLAMYPEPLGLGAALLTTQLSLLGRLLSRATLSTQLQILEVLIKCAGTNRGLGGSTSSGSVKEREQSAVRMGCCTSAAVAALSGLVPMMRRSSRLHVDPTDKLPERVLALANAVLDDHSSDPALSRCAALLFAASAALGTEAWCIRLQRGLVTEVSNSAQEGRDAGRRGALCLALGCLHRLRGGLTMQGALPYTTEALLLAASRPTRGGPPAVIWALHALALVAGYSGPAYLPQVKKTLRLCQDLLVSGVDIPGLHMSCSRLANSLVAVLGPEFTLGSAAYRMARSLITGELDASGGIIEIERGPGQQQAAAAAAPGAGGPAAGSTCTAAGSGGEFQQYALQAVLLVQQLILFAPQAVRAGRHVPLLRAALLSKRPALRRASAATLRQLAGRDAALLLPEGVEPALIAALDSETDSTVAEQLEGTLEVLMQAGAPSSPQRWIELLSQVAFAAPASTSLPGAAAAAGAGAGGGQEEEEDDDGPPVGKPPPKAAAKEGSSNGAAGAVSPEAAAALHPLPALLSSWLRLRTRAFAADLLGRMVEVISSAGRDSDKGTPELLQVLVDIGFRLATGSVEALKPAGVRMLKQLLLGFSALEDPLQPGALLLEQYQAQFVSTLRAALQPGVHPSLAIAGGTLASVFLKSGVAAGDAQVMRRLMELLTTPLADWQSISYEQYADWVTVHARVALLQAHAQCANIQLHGGDQVTVDIVVRAHKPYLSMLRSLWYALLQDHALLDTQHSSTLTAYASELFPPASAAAAAASADLSGGISPSVAHAVRAAYFEACPAVLSALSGSLPSVDILEQGGTECARYCRLLEAALMIATKAGAEIEEELRSGRQQQQQQQLQHLSALTSSCTRLAAALRCLKALLAPAVLASPALWQDVGPACTDTAEALVLLSTGGLAQLAWAACKEAQEPDPGQQARGLTSALPLLLQTLSAAASLALGLASGLPQERLQEEPPAEQQLEEEAGAEDMRRLPLASVLSEVLVALSSLAAPFMLVTDSVDPPASPSPSRAASSPPLPLPSSGSCALPRLLLSSELEPFLAPLPLPLLPGSAEAVQLDQVMAQVQQAAISLLQRAPTGSLLANCCAPALLSMGVRLLLTGPPGPPLAAAQAFVEHMAAALSERASDDADISSSGMGRFSFRQDSRGRGTVGGGGGGRVSEAGELRALECVHAVVLVLAAAVHSLIQGPAPEEGEEPSRLSALLSVALSLSIQLHQQQSHSQLAGLGEAAQAQVLRVLLASLQPEVVPAHQAQVLEALRARLQEPSEEGSGSRSWALDTFSCLGPAIAAVSRRAIRDAAAGAGAAAGQEHPAAVAACQVAAGSEGIRLLLAASSLSPSLQPAIMRVVVSLLVEAAAPEPPASPVPALRDMALRLVTSLPTSASAGPAFRAAVAAAPASSKSRLQAALKEAAAAAAPASGVGDGRSAAPSALAPKLPTIQLKSTFVLPLPTKK